jgi:t-SNARE complex subunit (syntaxin)
MNETDPQLERIEQLLREGNDLRRQAIVAQQASLTLQKSLVDEQRAILGKAGQVTEQALQLQRRARKLFTVIIPVLFLLIAYVSYLLFFRSYR